ncbi:hypothetical protein ALC60_03081, partial [Trachymyrmex zeteki]
NNQSTRAIIGANIYPTDKEQIDIRESGLLYSLAGGSSKAASRRTPPIRKSVCLPLGANAVGAIGTAKRHRNAREPLPLIAADSWRSDERRREESESRMEREEEDEREKEKGFIITQVRRLLTAIADNRFPDESTIGSS